MENEFAKFIREEESRSWLSWVRIQLLLILDRDGLYDKWAWNKVRRMCAIDGTEPAATSM